MYTVNVRMYAGVHGVIIPWSHDQITKFTNRPDTAPWHGALFICGKCGTRDCTCGGTVEPTFEPSDESTVNMTRMAYGMSYNINTLEKWGIPTAEYRSMSDWMQLFYATVACDIYTGYKHHELAQEKVKYIADHLAKAVTISCLGEARYVVLCVLHELHIRGKEPATIRRLMDSRLGRWAKALLLSYARGEQPYSHVPTRNDVRDWAARVTEDEDWTDEDLPHIVAMNTGGSRDLAVLCEPPMGLAPVEQARLARSAFVMHTRFCGHQNPADGTDSFAGPLWAHGADLAVRYYSGKMSPMMFIDQVFDAVHNSSSILSKIIPSINSDLDGWYLNWRQSASLDTLVMGSPTTVRRMFGIEDDDPQVPHLPLQLLITAHGVVPNETDSEALEAMTRRYAEWWRQTEWRAVEESPGFDPGFEFVVVSPTGVDTIPYHYKPATPLPQPHYDQMTGWTYPPEKTSNKIAGGQVHYWTQLPREFRQWHHETYYGAGSYVRRSQQRLREAMKGKYRYSWRPIGLLASVERGDPARLQELFGDTPGLLAPHHCGLCDGRDSHLLNRMRACMGQFQWPKGVTFNGSDCYDGYSDCLCRTLGYSCHEAVSGECEGDCDTGNCYLDYSDCYCRDETCCHGDYIGDSCEDYCDCDTCNGQYCSQGQRGCCCAENSCCHGYETGEGCGDDCECAYCEEAREDARLEAEAEAELEAAEEHKEAVVGG